MSLTSIFSKALLAAGIISQRLARTQLHAAIESDDAPAVVDILLKFPDAAFGFTSAEDGTRHTMIESALNNNAWKSVKALLTAAPSLLKCDYSRSEAEPAGTTLLMRRIRDGAPAYEAELFKRHGCSLLEQDSLGNTSMHVAAACGSVTFATALVSHGVSVDAVNKNGETPLMLATTGYTADASKSLLDLGADIAVRDAKGLNATMHALNNHNIKAAHLLMEQGGKVLDHTDPAIERIRRVAEHEAEWDFLRLLNSQYDISRNRHDDLAQMTIKEICETGTAEELRVKPIRLKPRAP
jgi:ankyrin repeat protein